MDSSHKVNRRIIIDGRAIMNQVDGIGRYSLNLVRTIVRLMPHTAVVLLIRNNLDEKKFKAYFSDVELVRLPFVHISPQTLWRLGGIVDSLGADLYHSLFMLHPLQMKTPGIVTIHDTIWFRRPWLQSSGSFIFMVMGWAYYRMAVKMSVAKACKVITVSDATRRDVCDCWPLIRPKIKVISEGVDKSFAITGTTADGLKRYGLNDKNYFLHSSNGKPYKNTQTVLKAYAKANIDIPLVIIGRRSSFSDTINHQIDGLGLRHRVMFLGSVPGKYATCLFQHAMALLFPSLYEGFGLPIVEAMAAGTPVITSYISSMPEVAGDAAILVNPYSTDDLVKAILQIVQDERLRKTLTEKGRIRAQQFSWEKTAQQVSEVYQEILGFEH